MSQTAAKLRAFLSSQLDSPVLRGFLSSQLDYRLPKKVGWPHTLGGALLVLFGIQCLTGILLALYYSPSTAEAHKSIVYIQEQIPAGNIIRGVHHWAASAFIVLAALHIVRVFVWAAYKGERRWTWLVGCLLLFCLVGFGFTGYLLPWDLKGYFGTRVGVEIAASAPVVGPMTKQLLQGGPSLGPLTLVRFYAVHVALLPLVFLGLLGLHLFLVRLLGITPPWRAVNDEDSAPRGAAFYPTQVAYDLGVGLVLVLSLLALGAWAGAPLEAPADPQNTTYVPRPEWYFLGLQQLLRVFQGPLELLGTVIIPTLAAGLLFALPWIDRNPSRLPRERKLALSLGGLALALTVGFTLWGYLAVRAEETAMAKRKARAPEPTAPTPTEEIAPPQGPVARGQALYEALRCARCHEGPDVGTGLNVPPSLAHAGSRVRGGWLRTYLARPTRIRFATDGEYPTERMPDYHLSPEEAAALAGFLAQRRDPERIPAGAAPSSDPELAKDGKLLVAQYQCLGCHQIAGEGAEIGPHLDGVAARLQTDYMRALLSDPQRVIPKTAMKDLDLWNEELEAVLAYLETLR